MGTHHIAEVGECLVELPTLLLPSGLHLVGEVPLHMPHSLLPSGLHLVRLPARAPTSCNARPRSQPWLEGGGGLRPGLKDAEAVDSTPP